MKNISTYSKNLISIRIRFIKIDSFKILNIKNFRQGEVINIPFSIIHHLKFLFCFILILYIEKGVAQEILSTKCTIDFTEIPLEEVLKYIQKKNGVGFSYSKNLINVDIKISIKSYEKELYKILDEIFRERNILYFCKSNIIILQPKPQNLDKIILNGTVYNSENKPIEFASIQMKTSMDGAISDMNGKFKMVVRKSELADSLIISSLGYEKENFLASGFFIQGERIVYLRQKIIQLPQINILGRNFKKKTIGNKAFFCLGSIYMDTHGQQTALFIENDKQKEGFITGAKFYLSKRGNTRAPFRIRMYEKDSLSGKPGKDLLTEVVIAKPKGENGWFRIDLEQLNIKIPALGFFLGFEGIYPGNMDEESVLEFKDIADNENNNDEIPASISYGQQLGYSRARGNNTWHYSLAHKWFQLEKNNFNVMMVAEIQIRELKN